MKVSCLVLAIWITGSDKKSTIFKWHWLIFTNSSYSWEIIISAVLIKNESSDKSGLIWFTVTGVTVIYSIDHIKKTISISAGTVVRDLHTIKMVVLMLCCRKTFGPIWLIKHRCLHTSLLLPMTNLSLRFSTHGGWSIWKLLHTLLAKEVPNIVGCNDITHPRTFFFSSF